MNKCKYISEIAKELGIENIGLKAYEFREKLDKFLNPYLNNTIRLKVHRKDLLQFIVILAYLNPRLGKFIKEHSIGSQYDDIEAYIEIDKDFYEKIELEVYVKKVKFPPPYRDHYYQHCFKLNFEKLKEISKLLEEEKIK
jgi:hypothetical protein